MIARSTLEAPQPSSTTLSRHSHLGACYFDNCAATPMGPAAITALRESSERWWANPSSLHGTGREARDAVHIVERLIREVVDGPSTKIAFTGSGTEANNMALLGFWRGNCKPGDRVISSRFEHPSILESLDELKRLGADVVLADIDRNGQVRVDQIREHLNDRTRLVSVMAVNNELGTIQPLAQIGAAVREHKAVFHTDAVQAVGKVQISMNDAKIDLLSLSGHKFHGPRGVGALVMGPRVDLARITFGGAAESLLRPGTMNAPGIVALGAALQDYIADREKYSGRRQALDRSLRQRIESQGLALKLNTGTAPRVPGIFNLRAEGVDADSLIQHLDYFDVHVSRGSACSAASPKLSHTLTAMGLTAEEIRESFRISLGAFNTEQELDRLFEVLPPLLACVRELPDKSTYVGALMAGPGEV